MQDLNNRTFLLWYVRHVPLGEGKKRYLWLATRMGMPTVKDAPGIEIVQTYNLLTHDQIVGMVMKNLV